MLDRRHRLTSPADFSTATRRGRRAGTATVVLHLAAVAQQDAGLSQEPRVGLVVGKSVGNAVRRNLVKRRLRHLARARVSSLPAGGLLVVRALPASAAATYDSLGRDFDGALRRLHPGTGPGAAGAARTGVSR